MSFPNLKHVNEFLKSVTLERPNEVGFDHSALTSGGTAVDSVKGTLNFHRGLVLWYRPVGDFSLPSLLRLISRELLSRNHVVTPPIAGIVVALFALNPRRSQDPLAALNVLFETISAARLRQVYATALPGNIMEKFSFGGFDLGLAPAASIQAETIGIGSDVFSRVANELKGRFAIERSIDCMIIDHNRYGVLLAASDFERAYAVVEEYFQALSETYWERFWEAFDGEHALQVCFGAPYLDIKSLQIGRVTSLSIFKVRAHGKGWAVPTGSYPRIELAKADKKIPAVNAELTKNFKFKGFRSTEFDGYINRIVDYMFFAHLDLLEEKYSDAVLKFVIALDLLFGEEGKNTDTVSRRSAVLIFRRFETDITKARRRIQELYNVRSRYVHLGERLTEMQAKEAENVCEEILSCMLRVRYQNEKSKEPGFTENWLKLIDMIWSTAEAKRLIVEGDLVGVGVAPLVIQDD